MAQPNGPYPTSEVSFWLRGGLSGVFLLMGKDRKRADYLGTSESDIKSELLKLSETIRDSWFSYYCASSPSRMYRIECEWYHRYNPSNYLDHPKPPLQNAQFKCPVPGCKFA
jgi:hypothetical protein